MVEWNELDVASFLEQVTGFLAEHGQLDGPSCNAPPAKRARSVRLLPYVLFKSGSSNVCFFKCVYSTSIDPVPPPVVVVLCLRRV